MANATALDERLAAFENDPILLSTGQSLLTFVDQLEEFNSKYLKEEDSGEYGTIWKQVGYTKKVADEPSEDMSKEDIATARKLIKTVDDLQAKLTAARKEAATFAANQLGISVASEKVEIPEEELEAMKKSVREPAVNLATTLATLATAIKATDESKAESIKEFLAKYPIPQVGRKGKLDVTDVKEQAKRHRVDVKAVDSEGKELFNVKGLTKAAAQKGTPSVDEFRKVFEQNGANKEVSFEHDGVTYTITPRKS